MEYYFVVINTIILIIIIVVTLDKHVHYFPDTLKALDMNDLICIPAFKDSAVWHYFGPVFSY
jgi:hypothetical protein